MSSKYLPAGTRVLLRDPDQNDSWYTTKVEVDMEMATETTCPRTGRQVLTVAQGKYRLYAAPESVCLRRADIPQMSILNYDISDDAFRTEVAGILMRIAVRTTQSSWVVPTNATPHHVIDRIREAGDVVTLYKYDVSEGPSLLAAIEDTLRAQIKAAADSAEASAESAAEQYANSDKPNRNKYFEQRIKSAAKLAADRLEAYAEAAKVFGFDANLLGRTAAAGVAWAIQTGIHLRAQKYVEAVAALRAQNTATGTALADAAHADNIPAGILADAIEDQGGDASGLRAAFAEVAPATDDGVFSLDTGD